jgi:hypothetical protein
MDLLGVIAHEFGHIVLAMDESAQPNDVMTEVLPVAVRRMPTPGDLGLQPSTVWANSHNSLGLRVQVGGSDAWAFFGRPALFVTGPAAPAPIPRKLDPARPLSPADVGPVAPASAARTTVDQLFSARWNTSELGGLANEELEFLALDLLGDS